MALVVRRLSKAYGTQVALKQIDLTLSSGIVALLGANGSGKSTLLRILATLSKPDSGDIWLDDLHYDADALRHLRRGIGYMPQNLYLPEHLTPRKLLHHLGRLRQTQRSQVEALLRALHLDALANQSLAKLSGGQMQLLGLAQALLGSPRMLLLDELTRGLDVSEREHALRLITRQGKLVIFSTHLPEDAESIAQWVVVLRQGNVLFSGAVDSLRAAAVGQVFELNVSPEQLPRLSETLLVSRITQQEGQAKLRVIGKPAQHEAVSVTPSLEEAYLLLTQRAKHTMGEH